MNTVKAIKTVKNLLVLALFLMLPQFARATEYTWTPTAAGTTYAWTNALNWGGSGYPHLAGDVANINNDIAGAQTIQLRGNITVGEIKLGDSAGTVYKTTIENKAGESYALSLDSGTAGVAAKLTLSSISNVIHFLNAPIVLNSDWTIDLAGTDSKNAQKLSFGSTVNIGSKSLKFIGGILGVTGAQITFTSSSEFLGTGSLINNSSSTIGTDGKKSFPGKIFLTGLSSGSNVGTLTITTGGFTNASEVVVNGYSTNSTVRMGALLHEGTGTPLSTNPGQRYTFNQVTLNGGYMIKVGQPPLLSSTNDWGMKLEWDRDDISVLDFRSGYSYISIGSHTNNSGSVFYIKTFKRSPGACCYLFGANTSNRVMFVQNAADFLIGSATDSGTARKIMPWLFINNGVGANGTPTGFATYDSAGGIRLLDTGTTESETTITAGAEKNVNTKEITLTTDTTVNSLRFNSNSDNIGAGRILTITSGGLFFANEALSLGLSGDPLAGTVNFGSAEGIITSILSYSNTIGAAISGSGGITKAQTGRLTLTGANTFSGPVHVAGGTLRVGDGTYASNLGSGDVTVHAGANLKISCANAIANSATVKLFNLGPDMYFGKMEIDAGQNETVRFLFLGDEPMTAGAYGGTGSGATYILPNYFSGTGVLTVSNNAAALGGTTLIVVR